MTRIWRPMATADQRRFARVPFRSTTWYRHALDEDGAAGICQDLCRGGMRLLMGRYLRPGRLVLLRLEVPAGDSPLEIKGRVIWCRPAAEPCLFSAGIRVYDDDPAATETFDRLIAPAQASPAQAAPAAVRAAIGDRNKTYGLTGRARHPFGIAITATLA